MNTMKILKNIAASILSLAGLWVVGFALFASFALFSPPQEQSTTSDAIIVLTGGSNRIQEGLALFAEKKSRNLFISGVNKDVTRNELLGLWHGKSPLPPCCITLGYEATSTEENALETRKWVQENNIKSIRLVTGNYHMARSLLELRQMLPGVKIYIHPVAQPDLGTGSRRLWLLLLLEYNKTLYRSVQLMLPQEAK